MERLSDVLEPQEAELVDDMGPAALVRGHWEELSRRAEYLAEPVRAIVVDPQQLLERFVSELNRHRRGIAKLGALGVGSLGIGFAAGAASFSHRH